MNSSASTSVTSATSDRDGGSLRANVQNVLDLIRPAVQSDGGDVELVDVTADGVVSVRLHGACVGCPSSAITLQTGIERSLRQRVPGVTAVRAID
jgi:Fe-S cluster biogenesis protein NfuA